MSGSTPTSSLPPNTLNVLSHEEQDALKVAVFQRLHPRLYLGRFLAEKLRPDGRPLDAFRGISVNVGSISTADGSALVRIGHTTVVCGVKAEIAEPDLDKENTGFLVPNVDLPAMCSPKFKPGPPGDEAQVLSERLSQVLAVSNLLPLDTLCIHRGKSAWVLYVDATCINYDGNIFDATLLAMVAALKNTLLPHASYNPETERTTCSRKLPKRPLSLASSIPLGVSFGVYDASYLLADPTAFEEPLLSTNVSVVLGNKPNAAQPPPAPQVPTSSKLKAKAKAKSQTEVTPESNRGSGEGFSVIWVSQTGPATLQPPPDEPSVEKQDVLEFCLPIAQRQRAALERALDEALLTTSSN